MSEPRKGAKRKLVLEDPRTPTDSPTPLAHAPLTPVAPGCSSWSDIPAAPPTAPTPCFTYSEPIPVVIRNLPQALQTKPLIEWTAEEIHQELGVLSDDDKTEDDDDSSQSISDLDELASLDEYSDDSIEDSSGRGHPDIAPEVTHSLPSAHGNLMEEPSGYELGHPEIAPEITGSMSSAHGSSMEEFPDHRHADITSEVIDPMPSPHGSLMEASPDHGQPDVSPTVDVSPVSHGQPNVSPVSLDASPPSGQGVPSATQIRWVQQNPNIQRNDFIGSGGLKVDFSGRDPYEWWCLLVSDDFLQVIVEETNRHALALFLDHEHVRARITSWKVLDVPEFKVFLGLLFTTGIVTLPSLEMHWKRNLLKDLTFPLTPGFGMYMPRDRFTVILQALHFAKNPSTPQEIAEADPLYKIQYLVDYFHTKMRSIYYPNRNLCIDESLVLWRGRLSFRQYLPMKAHKYGIKLYVLAEPSGLILRFLVYVGKKDRELAGANHASKVVTKLLTGYLDQGHSLFTDNYYNSVPLTQTLLERNTYVTGTLRSNRRGNPDFLNKKLRKNEVVSGFTPSGICVLKWKDKRDVRMISSEFQETMLEVKTRTKTVKKPHCIIKYNDYMGGVDKSDQMMSYYPCERKSIKWYKKLGIHILDMMMGNVCLLSNQFNINTQRTLECRLSVIQGLLSSKPIVQPVTPPSRFRDILHVPEKAVGKNGKALYRKCKNCLSKKKKVRKDVYTRCADCEPPTFLCLPECFREWHMKHVYN